MGDNWRQQANNEPKAGKQERKKKGERERERFKDMCHCIN